MGTNQVIVHERAEFFIRKLEDLIDFMGRAEPVEEMQKRHTCLESSSHRDDCEIMCFLDGARGEQCPTGLANSHHILMVAVDGESMRCNGACGNMEDCAGEFTSDLVHVWDH